MAHLIKYKNRSHLPDNATALRLIREETPKLAVLAVRERLALAKRIAFAGVAIAANDDDVDLSAAEAAITALQTGFKYKAAGQHGGSALATLILHRRRLLGLHAPVTIASTKKSVTTEAATLAVTSHPETARQALIDGARPGKDFVLLDTGADGKYAIELRLVEGVEPSLSDTEMQKVHFMSPIGALDVSSIGCWFGAAEAVQKGAFLLLEPGRYALQIYTTGFVSGIRAVLARNDDIHTAFEQPLNLQA